MSHFAVSTMFVGHLVETFTVNYGKQQNSTKSTVDTLQKSDLIHIIHCLWFLVSPNVLCSFNLMDLVNTYAYIRKMLLVCLLLLVHFCNVH